MVNGLNGRGNGKGASAEQFGIHMPSMNSPKRGHFSYADPDGVTSILELTGGSRGTGGTSGNDPPRGGF